MRPDGEGPEGVPECRERRLDLVADGKGAESTPPAPPPPPPPRLVRGCCFVEKGVWSGSAEKPSSGAGEGISGTWWASLDLGLGWVGPEVKSSFLIPESKDDE